MSTSFWSTKWRGERSFRSKYPRLFSISNQKESMVGEIGEEDGALTVWNFDWRWEFFDWEEQLFASLLVDLEGLLGSHEADRWKWNLDELGIFSVKSTYGKLEGLLLREDLWSMEEKGV